MRAMRADALPQSTRGPVGPALSPSALPFKHLPPVRATPGSGAVALACARAPRCSRDSAFLPWGLTIDQETVQKTSRPGQPHGHAASQDGNTTFVPTPGCCHTSCGSQSPCLPRRLFWKESLSAGAVHSPSARPSGHVGGDGALGAGSAWVGLILITQGS